MISYVTVSAIADLHGHLPQMPKADLTVICGDIFPGEMDKDPEAQGTWFKNVFLPWVDKIESQLVVLVAGNHDHWIAAHNDELLRDFAPSAGKKLVYLCDCGMEFYGLKIYGTPWIPTPFRNKAFSLVSDEELARKYALIPQKLDLLLTHTVPYDCDRIGFSEKDQRDLGCKELCKVIEKRNIRYLVGGHIHESMSRTAHMDFWGHHTEMVNVAYCDNQKQAIRRSVHFFSIHQYSEDEARKRIIQDFGLATGELGHRCLGRHPVLLEIGEAEYDFDQGITQNFQIDWDIVDFDESHIYITNLATGNRYNISVIYPAALYVDVYRVLEDGTEVDPFDD